jgi:hypothetical protein
MRESELTPYFAALVYQSPNCADSGTIQGTTAAETLGSCFGLLLRATSSLTVTKLRPSIMRFGCQVVGS